ncbi:hypothetical protein EV360DRAFT_88563 [Lentinula raphanica]|nr:hypothetical protein EV360DRAFT_88563 [Lentinula raphanica]
MPRSRQYHPGGTLKKVFSEWELQLQLPVAWLEVMIRLYSRLRDADQRMMSDWDFAKHPITLMTRDENWRYCRDELRKNLRVAEAARRTFSLQSVVHRLKDEDVELGIAPYITSLNTIMATRKGKAVDHTNHQVVPGIYTANEVANNASNTRYNQRDDRRFKPYPSQRPPSNRPSSTFNPNLICDNPYCVFAQGHAIENCFVYGGGKAGQYPNNYNGSRDLHLSPNARVTACRRQVLERVRGGRPTNGGNCFGGGGSRFAGLGAANVEPARRDNEVDNSLPDNDEPPTYAGMVEGGGDVEEEEVKEVIEGVEDEFVFMPMDVSGSLDLDKATEDEIHIDEEVKINAVALNLDIPQNDSINHDTGATRHIFRE